MDSGDFLLTNFLASFSQVAQAIRLTKAWRREVCAYDSQGLTYSPYLLQFLCTSSASM
jgi:hypothetical protein